MNQITARSRRWLAAMAMVAIWGLATANAVADPPSLKKSGQPNGVLPLAQREAGERSESPPAKENEEQPGRAWWDTAPASPDEQPSGDEYRDDNPDLLPKRKQDGLMDLENQLRRRAEMLLRELVELPAGQDAEARRLEAELKQVREEINRLHADFARPERRPEEPGPDLFAVLDERLDLAQRAIDVQCLIYELGDENDEQVGDLEDELNGINTRLEEIVARHPELEKDRGFLEMQLEFHRRAVQRMRQAGKPKAAERFMRDQLAIIRRLEKPQVESPAGQRDDLDRRTKHVEIAIDNLRAAGLDDFAERLVQELKRMVDEQRRQGPGFPVRPRRFEPPEIPEAPYRAQGYRPDRAELQRQVDRMQREMAELQRQVDRLLQQNLRGDPD